MSSGCVRGDGAGNVIAGVAAEGAWQVAFVALVVYAMLPLRAPDAAAFGLGLTIAHLIAAAFLPVYFRRLTWQQ
ncbi:hypothetical protein J437_LFUL008743, partial [Ladona fulva]